MIGLGLLEEMAGYDKVFVIDAATGIGHAPGEVVPLDQTEGSLDLFSTHGVNFFDLLRLGKELGLAMPEVGAAYGIEIGDTIAFGEELSPELRCTLESTICGIVDDIAGIVQGRKHSHETAGP